jgi:hypothetical protein
MKIQGLSINVFNEWSGMAFEMGKRAAREGLSSKDSPFDKNKYPWFHDRWIKGLTKETRRLTVNERTIDYIKKWEAA